MSRQSLRCALIALFVSSAFHFAGAQNCDVVWRKADNPRVISGEVTIPAGQSVCAEPGVIVQFNSNARLLIRGSLTALGTAAEPVVFNGATGLMRVLGTLDIRHGDIAVTSELNPGGTMLVDNSRFRARGGIHTVTQLVFTYESRFLLVQNSVFDSNAPTQGEEANIYVGQATVVLQNVTFRNGAWASIDRANFFARNVVGENLKYPLLTLAQFPPQPQYLDDLRVTSSLRECIQFQTGNYQFGPNTVLQGCEYPVKGGGGVLPGSFLPTAGNRNNWIESYILPHGIYGPQAIPYVMNGGRLSLAEISPGTTFKLKPGTGVDNPDGIVRVLGLPNAPITFEPWHTKWDRIKLGHDGDKMEYVVLDGMLRGLSDPGGLAASIYYVDQSVFRNNDIAVNDNGFSLFYLEGNLFTNNGVAVTGDSTGHRMNGITNPNLFENNGVAVRSLGDQGNPDVRNNWWNSPTGPTTPLNPGGTGDRIEGNAQFQPYRTVRPDPTDHPPVVRVTKRPFQITSGWYEGIFDRGQKIIVTWEAFDNATIVKQKVQTQALTNKKENFVTVADNLPGTQRSFEFTMPSTGGKHFIRIVATDDRGQEGWDEWVVRVPSPNEPGALQITAPLGGQTFRAGGEVQVNWQVTTPFNNSQFAVYVMLDGHRKALYEANGGQTGSFSTVKLPYVSTNSARIAVFSPNSRVFYSEPFAIRPDARYPDAPPQVTMTAPAAGQSFAAGSVVPITWTASDDEAIRQFNILYSTDSGRTWNTLVENLPPTATSYSWQTPPGSGFADVRVRVVALDLRFQNSSDGANRSFSLTPSGDAPTPTTVLSRKAHNGVAYDIDLPLTGRAIESRGGAHQVIFNFATPVSVAGAVVEGAANVDTYTASGTQIAVNLSGVANAQTVTVRLTGVSDGATTGNVSVQLGFLLGDVTGNGSVTSSDLGQVKAASGQPASATTSRADVNLSGSINASDLGVVKSMAGTTIQPDSGDRLSSVLREANEE